MVASSDRLPAFGLDGFTALEALSQQREVRLSSIGEMTATLAHQIRTPLASALLYAKQLRSQTKTQKVPADHICNRLDEIARLIDDMLCYAGGARRVEERFSIGELYRSIVEVFQNCVGEGQLNIALVHDDLTVSGNHDAIRGAMLNLVENALQASGETARVELGAELIEGRICLTVSDNGPGIAVDIKDRLFEPFFTTRPNGTGLGLAVVRAVAEAHGGEVIVDSSARGTTFALCLRAPGGAI